MLRFFGVGAEGYSPKPLPQKTKACVLPKNDVHSEVIKTEEFYECTRLIRIVGLK